MTATYSYLKLVEICKWHQLIVKHQHDSKLSKIILICFKYYVSVEFVWEHELDTYSFSEILSIVGVHITTKCI